LTDTIREDINPTSSGGQLSTPNVLLVVIDSLRADAVFGDHVETPTFDSHAQRGAQFRQCISTCTTTTPSFSSILTGCFPPKHGVRGLRGYRLSPAVTTMAEAFAAAGYKTYAEVTGPLLPQTDITRGFTDVRHRRGKGGPYFAWTGPVIDKLKSDAGPWFMLVHTWEVHRPYRTPSGFSKHHQRADYEAAVAGTDASIAPLLEAAGDNTLVIVTGDHGEDYPETALQMNLVRVARRTRRVLRLGSWFPFLDEKLAGMEIGHGFALYEHLIRVPLIITGPGVSPAVVDQQVRHVDLFPTLLDLSGVNTPQGIDGRTLRPLMDGEPAPEEPAYLEALGVKLEGRRISGARTPHWKLLRPGGRKPILYKLDGTAPPDEKRNLYARHPDEARALEAFIDKVAASEGTESGMSVEEEAVVEQHLRDLGYL
jgi:arylsulfatase A-like enzyme